MKMRIVAIFVIVTAGLVVMATRSPSINASSATAVMYTLDPVHSSFYFRIMHKGLSYAYGRFNDVQGRFQIGDTNTHDTKFSITVKTASIDTNHVKRDEHLRNLDFFNARQFPTIRFQSTDVHAHGQVLHVTGDLTMHGVTRPVGFHLKKIGKNAKAIGFSTQFKIKRSDFGMKKLLGPVGDEVELMVSFEGTRTG